MKNLKTFTLQAAVASCLLLLCALIVGPTSVQGAIVTNGDFENTVTFAADWNPVSVTGTSTVEALESNLAYAAPAHSGVIAVGFSSNPDAPANSLASISQTLATDSTKTYDVSFWIENTGELTDPRQNLFSVRWNNVLQDLSAYFSLPNPSNGELAGTAFQYVVDANTTWFQIVLTNLAPGAGSTTELKFEGQNNNWVTLVDDVLVQETPEPSTLVMLGAGAVLMGLRRRRQQRAA
jgi:hypothetical protein